MVVRDMELTTNNYMKCPMCPNKDGDKRLIDFLLWFICPACGYRCTMVSYRGKFEKNKI